MPPHLKPKSGPVGQHIQNLPPVMELCECYECVEHSGSDPQTGLPIRGRYLSSAELKAHRNQEKLRTTASAALAKTTINLTPPPPFHPMQSSSTIPIRTSLSAPPPVPPSPLRPDPQPSSEGGPEAINGDAVFLFLQTMKNNLPEHTDVMGQDPLIFHSPPTADSTPLDDDVPESYIESKQVNDPCALDSTAPANAAFISTEQLLAKNHSYVKSHATSPNVHTRLLCKLLIPDLERRITVLRNKRRTEWERQRTAIQKSGAVNSVNYFARRQLGLRPITFACYVLVVALHLFSAVSIDDCTYILEMLHEIVQLAFEASSSPPLTSANTTSSIYRDVRTIIDIMDLEPKAKAFVCCPKCFSLYRFDPNARDSFPQLCTNREFTDSEPCGRRLRKERKRKSGYIELPYRQFLYQDMKQWIARLYARPELADYLTRCPSTDASEETRDIWEAQALREFLGPDQKAPFIKGPANEGRLVFSLNMDGFNPYGNRTAGKKVSVGGIYMVCLNLPAAIRYEEANMYLVGIIPGPQQPSLHEINHLLKPLVDDLVDFWDPGVYITRTCRHQDGLLVRCAVVPLVCDLPAARQMSGFGHYKSLHFCSVCHLPLESINDLNHKCWVPRTLEEHLEAAREWRDASTLAERERLHERDGIRWSELLRLPYWDPIKFTVIDSMHSFYLGLLQHHCRKIWGMDVNLKDGDGTRSDDKGLANEAEMAAAHSILKSSSKTRLVELPALILRQLCRELSLDFRGKKKLLIKRLLEYRVRTAALADLVTPSSKQPESGAVLDRLSFHRQTRDPTALKSRFKLQEITTAEDARDFFRHASKTSINKLPKSKLVLLCETNNIGPGALDSNLQSLTIQNLRDRIQEQRQKEGIVDEKGKLIASSVRKTAVLGSGVLEEIRNDMKNTQLPSWLAPAPKNPGEKKWGKFTADQWRAFCMVNLPITLIRLWGDKGKDTREYRMLVNFMHLVAAIKLATTRKLTTSLVLQYESHMEQYLRSLLELYDHASITPYQHLSLHFGSFLRRFGPTHSWRCFPFERYNYLMQQIPINSKFGEMEKTMFRRFCMGQNLQILFHVDEVSSSLHRVIDIFRRHFHRSTRNAVSTNVMVFDENFNKVEEMASWDIKNSHTLPEATYELLRHWISAHDPAMAHGTILNAVFKRNEIKRLGQTFQSHQGFVPNSRILYDTQDGNELSAGRIIEIFSHMRTRPAGQTITQTFCVVSAYVPLRPHHTSFDHYREFLVGGRLFYDRFEPNLVLVSIDDVNCHFLHSVRGIRGINRAVMHAFPLDKVNKAPFFIFHAIY